MTPSARVQAAIEILDQVVASARDDGPPADAIVTAYFKTRRYAGSKDRRAVRELVFRAIRRSAEIAYDGRSAMLGLSADDREILDSFTGPPHGPDPVVKGEKRTRASLIPQWVETELSPLVTPAEWAALVQRAPLDIRVNTARTTREAMLEAFPGATLTPLSPWGLRLPADTRVDQHPAFAEGLVEVQDEGSQLIALACGAKPGMRIVDLCAGAGGKALALAAATANAAEIVACDTNRQRLSRLSPRADRAGATISTRLLDAPREAEALVALQGSADLVLVDAPCSGSGTWRRSPEGRWRLTPDRLDRVIVLQARVLDLAAPLVKSGGMLVYAACSLLSREGADQVGAFLGRHSGWTVQDPLGDVGNGLGRSEGVGRLLTPAHDETDGFFVARLIRSC
ncbi:RsmB/NOP family class I SAM-dependent RNA methyltransferase [Sphingomonas sp.]|uniref:RsmB/NOP family class I SAM-dependent RNA methyltransferase n=1 Tax=Sphingomonas sp. TaxID=28214 RepID=UPI00325FD5F3